MQDADDTGHSSDESFALPALSSYALELLSVAESNQSFNNGDAVDTKDAVGSVVRSNKSDRRSSGLVTQYTDVRDRSNTRHCVSSSPPSTTPYQLYTPGIATPFTRSSGSNGSHTVEPTSQYRSIFRKSQPGRLGPPKRTVRRRSQESDGNADFNPRTSKSPSASPRERKAPSSTFSRSDADDSQGDLLGELYLHKFQKQSSLGKSISAGNNRSPISLSHQEEGIEKLQSHENAITGARLRFLDRDEEIPPTDKRSSDAHTQNSYISKDSGERKQTLSSDFANLDVASSRSSYMDSEPLSASIIRDQKIDVFHETQAADEAISLPAAQQSQHSWSPTGAYNANMHSIPSSDKSLRPEYSRSLLSPKPVLETKSAHTKPSTKIFYDENRENSLQPKLQPNVRSQGRQLLTPLSSNVVRPLRTSTPPPECNVFQPPPKMNNLDVPKPTPKALAKKPKNTVIVAGRAYQRLELLGKGGSSKVYKVQLANTTKIYAMKKVTFDEVDEAVVRGFKGEIELLRKLSNEDRVVKLVDFQILDGSVNMIMECGEIDLAHVLSSRLNYPLDLSFLRYHTSEMLQCVAAVHQHGIVHSDLKPANFLFVKGMLKIIDFGIANAVPDYTSNVHRETQMGTPNYMAPEALMDVSQLDPSLPPGKKCTKVGTPSDVWSCGCIIYQMVYGKPPYASYTGTHRVLAIMNPNVQVVYPETGLGGTYVSKDVIAVMKGCLDRDPLQRSTIADVMEGQFIRPRYMSKEVLRELLTQSVKYGAERGVVESDDIALLTEDVWKKIGLLNKNS
ncbi:kinase-like domain-containing protein [Lipomyces arxii]|uniref:kinase-like domain-containing protein n=1 Tax=Lipomyces arxii TaxID=56418 RepID=UPI0034CE58C9